MPNSPPRPNRRAAGRRRCLLTLGGSAVTALAVGAAMVITADPPARPPAPTTPQPAVSIAAAEMGSDHDYAGPHAPFIGVAEYWPIYQRNDPGYVLVDAREAGERAARRIPGSIWVPISDVEDTGWRFLRRYREQTIVLYCDCPNAEAAYESAVLAEHGFSDQQLRVLREGLSAWAGAGHPTTGGGDPCTDEHRWPNAC